MMFRSQNLKGVLLALATGGSSSISQAEANCIVDEIVAVKVSKLYVALNNAHHLLSFLFFFFRVLQAAQV